MSLSVGRIDLVGCFDIIQSLLRPSHSEVAVRPSVKSLEVFGATLQYLAAAYNCLGVVPDFVLGVRQIEKQHKGQVSGFLDNIRGGVKELVGVQDFQTLEVGLDRLYVLSLLEVLIPDVLYLVAFVHSLSRGIDRWLVACFWCLGHTLVSWLFHQFLLVGVVNFSYYGRGWTSVVVLVDWSLTHWLVHMLVLRLNVWEFFFPFLSLGDLRQTLIGLVYC